MLLTFKIARVTILLFGVLIIGACSTDYELQVLGTWKEVNQERYLRIEKRPKLDSGISAILYAPSNASDNPGDIVVMNHRSMSAAMQDGVLVLKLEAGDVPVLYDPVTHLVVLNGTRQYKKMPENTAMQKLKL